MGGMKAGDKIVEGEERMGFDPDAVGSLIGIFRTLDDQEQDAKRRRRDKLPAGAGDPPVFHPPGAKRGKPS